jgi:sec-independent protein translocase protein TatB
MPQIGWFEILLIVVVSILVIGPNDFPIMLKKIGSWIGSIKKYFNELQSEVALYEHENDKEKNLSKNKARDTKDEK